MARTKALRRRVRGSRARGFTLIEVTFALVILGLGVAALMMLLGSGTTVNAFGNNMSTGVFLNEQLRAMTDETPFDDLISSFHGQVYNGVDASGNAVAGLEGFQQRLSVQAVSPDDLTVYVGPNVEAVIITADVLYGGEQLTRVSWLRVKP